MRVCPLTGVSWVRPPSPTQKNDLLYGGLFFTQMLGLHPKGASYLSVLVGSTPIAHQR